MKFPIRRLQLVSLAVCVAALLAAPAPGARAQTRFERSMAARVLSKMHHINQLEIAMGQMAIDKSDDPDVRAFGRQLRRDHRDNDRQVMALADREGIDLVNPTPRTREERRMAQQEQMMRRRLRNAVGTDFDREFMRFMAQGHANAIQTLREARQDLPTGPVRSLVVSTIPGVRMHLRHARDLEQSM